MTVVSWRRILDLPLHHVAHAFLPDGVGCCGHARRHAYKMVPCPEPSSLEVCPECARYLRENRGLRPAPVDLAERREKLHARKRDEARLAVARTLARFALPEHDRKQVLFDLMVGSVEELLGTR